MARTRSFQTNFTAGEFSPRLEGRTDITRYANAVKTLTNFMILTHGGVTRRPGTKFVAEVKTSADTGTILVPFEFSRIQAYILEFGNLYVRFYKDSGRIESGGSAVEVVTPYAKADLSGLKFAQSADTLYIVHSSYAPRKLTRTSHTAWTLTTIAFTDGPYLEAASTPTFTPSAVTGTGITLTASAAFFDTSSPSQHINAFIRLKHLLVPGTPTVTPQGTTGSTGYSYRITSVDAVGESTWGTAGTTATGNATLSQTNFNRVTWTDIAGAKAYRIYGRVANAQLFIAEVPGDINTFDDIGGIAPNGASPRTDTTDTWGYAQITAVTNSTTATADVKSDFGNTTASNKFREGAWSTKQGFPAAVTFFEDRLVFGGSTNRPQTLDGSKSGSYEDFTPGTRDDDAISFTIAANQVNAIAWLATARSILIGTIGNEFRAGATDEDPITPTNFNVKAETPWGSMSTVAPLRVGGATLFAQRGGRILREMSFALDLDAYVAPDLTILSEHLFGKNKIVQQMAFSKSRDPMVWVVRSDGALCTMTYDRSQDVVGWGRLVTGRAQDLADGKFESVAVIPHPSEATGAPEQVWVIANRTVNKETKRFVEYFETTGVYYADQHVDSGLTYNGTKAIAMTLGATTGTNVLFTATAAFAAGDVGKEIRELTGTSPGRATIISFTNANSVRADINNTFSSTSIAASAWALAVFSVTGLAHLATETVEVVGDGAVYNSVAVSATGVVTLVPPIAASKLEIGLGYDSTLVTLRPDVTGAATIQGLIKRNPEIVVRLYQTLGVTVNDEIIPFRKAGDRMDQPPALADLDERKTNLGFSRDALITVKQDQPLPATIIGIISEVEFADR